MLVIIILILLALVLVVFLTACLTATPPDEYGPAKDHLKEAKEMEREVFSRLGELEQKLKESPAERDKQEINSEMQEIQTMMNAWEQKIQEAVRSLPPDYVRSDGGDGGDDGSDGGDDGGDGDD
ncbi:MAG: hypothetical protein LUD72_11700 [Bacteroidales bacterium]|nr:hypothetical protein [Bacteroidales bacterium]